MDTASFRRELFAEAKKQGCSAAEIYCRTGEEYSVRVLEGEIEACDMNKTFGLCLRVEKDGRQGYAYTEACSGAALLAAKAADNAAAAGSEPSPMQAQGSYPEACPSPDRIGALSQQQRTNLALDLERAAKACDSRVARMAAAMVFCTRDIVEIENTEGLCVSEEMTSGGCYCAPIVAQGEEMRNAVAFRLGGEAEDISGCAKEAVALALAKLGGGSLPSGSYKIIIRSRAMAELLGAFSPMFSADMAQKGLSPLAGRTGEQIFSPLVTVIDDALHPINPRRFDDEGTPARTTVVAEKGKMCTMLHNAKTAAAFGAQSTGNAVKRGTASPAEVRPTNMYIAAGELTFAELTARLGDGIIIDDLAGLHSGANAVTGQFSLMASGQLVQGGRIIRPVEQITIAGDFVGLLADARALADDLAFALPSGGFFGAPSLLFGEMQVSGE